MASIDELFKAGVHFGYSRSSRHPKMKRFIFGLRNNIEVIDLEKTLQQLNKAKEFLKKLGKERKTILFVGTKPPIKDLIEKYAKEIDMPYVKERWLGGTLTNFEQIRKRCDYMQELINQREAGEFEKYTKKERLMLERKIAKMQEVFTGLEKLKELPSALVIVDTKEEDIAVKEANDMGIPVVGILNTDCDPEKIDYPLPGNDNSVSSVDYLLKELVEGYKEGLKESPKEENA